MRKWTRLFNLVVLYNMKKHCKYCDLEFEYLGGKGNYKDYCSRTCAYNTKKERESKVGKKTYKVCEECKKEYIYIFGQPNWTKNGTGNGRGTVRSDKFCCYECGVKNHMNKISNTNLNKYGTKCVLSAPQIKEKIKKTMKERYGVDNIFKSKDTWKKIKENNLEKYGVENPFQIEEVKTKIKQTNLERYGKEHVNLYGSEEFKQNMLEKYGTENASCNQEVKNKIQLAHLNKTKEERSIIQEKTKKTNMHKYGATYYAQSDEFKKTINSDKFKSQIKVRERKKYLTKKKNNSFHVSKPEKIISDMLLSVVPNTQHEYMSEKYPFSCDFYIPELDLYIEYQGTWTHGKEPFDETNEKHKEILNEWKSKGNELNWKNKPKSMYVNAIKIWTELDVKKRNWAKENNLNWIEFFNLEQFIEWLKQYK